MKMVVTLLIVVAMVQIQLGKTEEVYKHLTFPEMETYWKGLAKEYPNLLHLETAQDLYKLPYADCGTHKCPIYIATLTEFSTLSAERPQIFLSGAVHGDEIVGPNAVTYLAGYLLRNYGQDKWLTYLLQHRVIVIMPAANAQGYFNEYREEIIEKQSYDPNRDFPYDNPDGDCMNTVAARSILQVVKRHMFTLGITFHGGDNAIGYEWGSDNHLIDDKAEECPDDTALRQLGELLQSEAGEVAVHGIPKYDLGRMTDVVYSVQGGLEDWAYAASWANAIENRTLNLNCTATTYGGFNNSDLLHGPHAVRFPLYLVEAYYDKHPPDSKFGSEAGIKERNTTHDGHIPRNIRMCLATIDLAQPYIRDIVVAESISANQVTVSWKVGGALYVNETYVEWDSYDKSDYPPNVQSVTSAWPDHQAVTTMNRSFSHRTGTQSGKGIWLAPESKFSVTLPWPSSTNNKYIFRVVAITDLQISSQSNPNPRVSPLTHFARVRTTPGYVAAENDSLIFIPGRGTYSPTVVVTPFQEQVLGVSVGMFTGILIPVCTLAVIFLLAMYCCFRKKYMDYQPISKSNTATHV